MYTICNRCKEMFLGEAAAFNLMSQPYCAGCFNELAYSNLEDFKIKTVKPEDIPLYPDQSPGLFPPPTMG